MRELIDIKHVTFTSANNQPADNVSWAAMHIGLLARSGASCPAPVEYGGQQFMIIQRGVRVNEEKSHTVHMILKAYKPM